MKTNDGYLKPVPVLDKDLKDIEVFIPGYEGYVSYMPIITEGDDEGWEKFFVLNDIMEAIYEQVSRMKFPKEMFENGRRRLVLARTEQGTELVVGLWPKGFSTIIHAHDPGFMYEKLISGKLIVNDYNLVDFEQRSIRLRKQTPKNMGDRIITLKNSINDPLKNKYMIHRLDFEANSVTLHYLPAPGDIPAEEIKLLND